MTPEQKGRRSMKYQWVLAILFGGLSLLGGCTTKRAERKYNVELLFLEEQSPESHNNLGNSFANLGRIEEAIKEYHEAIRLKPDYALAHFNLGVTLRRKGEIEEAIKEYREAIRIDPDFSDAHNNLGYALGKMGKTEEEIKEYREAIRSDSGNPEAHFNLGAVFLKKKKLVEAITECREAVRLKPEQTMMQYNLACCYALHGDKQEAMDSLIMALEKGFNDWPLMKKDKHLDSLRDDPEFKELEEKVKVRWKERKKQ